MLRAVAFPSREIFNVSPAVTLSKKCFDRIVSHNCWWEWRMTVIWIRTCVLIEMNSTDHRPDFPMGREVELESVSFAKDLKDSERSDTLWSQFSGQGFLGVYSRGADEYRLCRR
jgi:hypothetical protein